MSTFLSLADFLGTRSIHASLQRTSTPIPPINGSIKAPESGKAVVPGTIAKVAHRL